jgi:hypothetical protein
MPVIPSTQEEEIGRSQVEASQSKVIWRLYLKYNKAKWTYRNNSSGRPLA